MTAPIEQLSLCPGLGEKRVRRLYDAFHKPFVASNSPIKKKRPSLDEFIFNPNKKQNVNNNNGIGITVNKNNVKNSNSNNFNDKNNENDEREQKDEEMVLNKDATMKEKNTATDPKIFVIDDDD